MRTVKSEALPTVKPSTNTLTRGKNGEETAKIVFPDNRKMVLALEMVKVGLWEWDMATNLVLWSDNVGSLFGLSAEDFEGTFEHYLRLIHPEDVPYLQDSIQSAITSGNDYSVEHRIVFPDGSIRWLECKGLVFVNEQGIPEKMSGTVRDITNEKRAEFQIQEREKLFTLLANTTKELFLNPIWDCAISKSFKKIGESVGVDRMYLFKLDGGQQSETISQLIEWSADTVEPQLNNPALQHLRLEEFEPFFELLLDGKELNKITRTISHEKLKTTLEEQAIQSILAFPIQVKSKFWGFLGFDQCSHERNWTELEVSILKSFSATLAGSIEKHEAEIEKDQWKVKHELIVRASGQIIYDYDILTGRIQWSGSLEELGYIQEEMGDINNWTNLLHPDDRDETVAASNAAKESLQKYDGYYRFLHKNGNYVNIHDKGFFLSDNNGKAYRMLGMMINVTEKVKQAMEKKEVELAYRTLFDNTPDAIIIATAEEPSKIVSANQAAAKMHGYELEEFNTLLVGDLKSTEFAASLNERLTHLLKGDRTTIESQHKRKDGSVFPVAVISGIITVHDQQYVMAIYQDISEFKQAKTKLKESLSLLTATLESTADGILVVDNYGKVSAFNKKFLKLWNIPSSLAHEYDDDKLIANALDQLVEPDQFIKKVKYLYANPSEKSEDLLTFKDGRVFQRYSKPQKIGDLVVGRVWSFRDITHQVNHEKSLEESHARFKRLQEASFGGVCIHDEGIIIDANQGLSEIFGHSNQELIGMDGLQKLIAPEYVETCHKNMQSGYDKPFDIEGIRKDGTRVFLEVHAKNIPYGGKTVRVSEFRDITARKKAEQKVLQEKTMLFSIAQNLTRKNEQLEEFTQIVSHNLRSPVGNISTLLNLHNKAEKIEEKNEILELLQRTSSSLLTTMAELNEVLKIKQNENIDRQELNFAEVFERVKAMFHAKIIETEALVTADFTQAPVVNYANIYLESIFLNLLSNALKYRNHKVVSTIHFRTETIGGCIVLHVSDNGLGIDLEKYGHQVFKMRKTFHRHSDSRGIGLFMVKNQVDSMGGEISIESKEDVGTVFTINFNKNL